VRLRLATLSDLPAMVEIERENPTTASWSHEHYKSLLRPAVNELSENFFIVLEALLESSESKSDPQPAPTPSIAGYLAAQAVDNVWDLQYIVIAKKFRRRGLATTLLNELIAHVRNKNVPNKNCSQIFLEVRASNQAAQALYSKLGFKVIGTRKNYYPAPQQEDAIRFVLAIS
jgi:ribosomal-protein-alanine acetyltransferase